MKTLSHISLIPLVSILLFFTIRAQAQEGMLSAKYHLALPQGAFDDFQQSNSYSGFTIDYYYRFPKNIEVGGFFGWQLFHKTFPKATYQLDEGAITMKQWRFTHVVPLAVGARYSLLTDKRITPYIGIGNGAYLVRQEVWVGLDEYIDEKWRYGIFPEAGIRLRVIDAFGFTLGSKYNFIVRGQRFADKEHLHFWDFNLGIYLNTGGGGNYREPVQEIPEY